MYRYFNANPLGRKVNDCTVRAISLATGKSWDFIYKILSEFARKEAVMMDNIKYIDKFLDSNFLKVYSHNSGYKMTVDEAAKEFNRGVYLITMQNHITCCIDGTIYDILSICKYNIGSYAESLYYIDLALEKVDLNKDSSLTSQDGLI